MKTQFLIIAVVLGLSLVASQVTLADDSTPPTMPDFGSGSGEGGEGIAPDAPPAELPDDGDSADDQPPTTPDTPAAQPPDQGGASDGGGKGESPHETPAPAAPSATPVVTDSGAGSPNPPAAATPPPTAAPVVTAAAPPPLGYCEATPTADIGVKAKADLSSSVVGSTVNYSVDVYVVQGGRNYCDAPDAALTFKVPPQLELLSSSSVSASEGSCSVTGDVGSQVATCRFESVGSDKDVLVHVSARADKPGKATAEAGVSTSSADPDTGDQSDSVSVVVTAPETAVQPKAVSVTKQVPSTPGQSRLKLPGSKTVQTTTSSKHLHPAASPPKRVLTLPTG